MGETDREIRKTIRPDIGMTLHINRNQLMAIAIIWEYTFLIFSATQSNNFQLLNIFGFLTLILLPGLLTMTLLRLDHLPFWAYVGLTIGFSLLELMITVLIGNSVLPHFGIMRPLDRPVLLAEFALLIPVLFGLNWGLDREPLFIIRPFLIFDSIRDAAIALIPIIFVALSIAGAIRLNNGADGVLTLIMLIGLGCYSALLVWQSKRLGPNVVSTALFFMALSLLLMTSLRGWSITGHDIQREFGVFQLTKGNGIWNIAAYRDAYNACMSITILPTIFSNLLKISDPYIYKVLFQLLFAIVPTVLFVLIRRYVSAAVAFLAVLYFISFPTFFGDMPFLNRQEIAFFFLVLMLYLLSSTKISLRMRQALFVLFGIGMVLSHYSTTYTVVALLLGLIVIRPIARVVGRYLARVRLSRNSAFALLHQSVRSRAFVTLWMVIVIALASFLWSSVLTNTASDSLSRVVTETIAVMRHTVHEDAQSNDVSYSLFSQHKIDLPALYTQYQKEIVAKIRAADPTAYYSNATYLQYPAPLTATDRLPLTAIGTAAEAKGFGVADFNDKLRDYSAKLLQLFVIIGLVGGLVSAAFVVTPIGTDFLLLAVSSLFFVVAQVVLPVLSVEYGVLRAFQQALFFLSIFVVGGSFSLLYRISIAKRVFFSSVLAIIFLFSSTGVFTQILGAYGAQLHLNNAGGYYDNYYLHKDEILATQWLKQRNIQPWNIQTTVLLTYQFVLDSSPASGIYPGLIRKSSYVLLGNQNVKKDEGGVSYNASDFVYVYPTSLLDNNKDLVYSSGGAEIYR